MTTTKEKTKHTLEMLHALTDGIDEVAYVVDPDSYIILFANKKTGELYGENMEGKKCHFALHRSNEPCSFCTMNRVLGKNLGKTYIQQEFQNQKNKHWYKCIDNTIRWPTDKDVFFEIAVDITERKEIENTLKEHEELFRSTVENSHDAIIIIDDKFRIVYANDEAERLAGYRKEKLLGRDFRKFLDSDTKALIQDRYVRRQNGENVPKQYEFKIVGSGGVKKNVEIKSTLIKDRLGRARTIAQLLDVTDHRRIEDERKYFEERLSALNMYGQNLNMAETIREIYTLTLDAAEKTLGFENASILMVQGRMLHLVSHRGYAKPFSLKLPLDGKKGVTVEAVNTGKPVFVPDVRKRKTYVKGEEGIRSELAVPVRVGDRFLGVLNVESKRVAAFDEKDIKLLEILASHAAIAISNLKREEKLSALNTYGRSLNKAGDAEKIYALTLNAVEKVLGFKFVDVFIIEGKMLRLAATSRLLKVNPFNFCLDGQKGVTVKAARTGKAVYVSDIRKEKAYIDGGFNGLLSELTVPIKLGNNVLGVLNVESERLAAFDTEDKELLEILASHTAIAMSNLRRREQLRSLSRKLESLMKSSTKIMHVTNMQQRLKVITQAIQKFGWGRVVLSLRDENLNIVKPEDIVTAGLTKQERDYLWTHSKSGQVWRERLGPEFERFRIGEFYYLPWSDPFVRRKFSDGVVLSHLTQQEMVDWNPDDLLYAPLRTPEGRIVGMLSMDDPVGGRRPTREVLTPLELFLHQAAITIDNAKLIGNLQEARRELKAYADKLEQMVEERTRELKVSQDQLLTAQRLAVIGELAGMVGHDLRNPLTSIAGAEYYLKKRMRSMDGKIKEMLELIEKNIAYSNKIINDLLDYSREVKLDLTENKPKNLVKEALSLIQAPNNVKIIDLTDNRSRIKVDAEKIKRTFINIIRNAIDAMPKGGTLTIRNRQVDSVMEFVFSDTGVGMTHETLAKLWTPLFTTKAKGMGFGLPICKRIIEAHGGSINIESVLRKGTTIVVTLPLEPEIPEQEGGEEIWVKTLESSLLTTTKT